MRQPIMRSIQAWSAVSTPSAMTTLSSVSDSVMTARMMAPASPSAGSLATKLWSILTLSTGSRPR